MPLSWMIYGANGYTGRLIAAEAKRRGLATVLAGRNRHETEALARELGFEARVFPCTEPAEIARNLEGVSLVLHCAGPFSATSRPMLEGCIRARAHYLDITGEIPVFERILRDPAPIARAGIVAMPGVGFDVVPSDCLAALLHRELPDAIRLEIALKMSASPSPGTTKTIIEGIHAGIVVRKAGKLVRLPAASLVRKVRFWDEPAPRPVVGLSWGDVSTAFYSTGIPEIQAYIAASKRTVRMMKLSTWISPLLALRPVQNGMKKLADRWVSGPSESARSNAPYFLWARMENAQGRSREMRLRTPNGYSLTVDSSLKAVERVLRGEVAPGAWTPSRAFGPEFLKTLEGIELR